jgi:hypothetical protein
MYGRASWLELLQSRRPWPLHLKKVSRHSREIIGIRQPVQFELRPGKSGSSCHHSGLGCPALPKQFMDNSLTRLDICGISSIRPHGGSSSKSEAALENFGSENSLAALILIAVMSEPNRLAKICLNNTNLTFFVVFDSLSESHSPHAKILDRLSSPVAEPHGPWPRVSSQFP